MHVSGREIGDGARGMLNDGMDVKATRAIHCTLLISVRRYFPRRRGSENKLHNWDDG